MLRFLYGEVHCRYKSKGNALLAALSAAFPDQSVTIAAGAPKRGSFDILVVAGGASMFHSMTPCVFFLRMPPSLSETCLSFVCALAATNVWNGLKMGPPRALKFLDHEKAVQLVKAATGAV